MFCLSGSENDKITAPRQNFFSFCEEITRTKVKKVRKMLWVRVPMKIVSVARKLSAIEGRKTALGSSLNEDFKFRDKILYDF
jgi:hypothetical protein